MDRVKKVGANLGLRHEQFAAKVGVTWSTVNRWENNRGKPSPLAMRQIEEMREALRKKQRIEIQGAKK